MKKIRIFIVDDHDVVREGFVSLIQENANYYVSGEASNGREAIERIRTMEFKPQVVLMDINMPEIDGMECTRILTENFPDIKVVALTMIQQNAHIRRMIDAGALGYILKSGSKLELYKAIDNAIEGKAYFSPVVSDEVLRHMTRLGEDSAHHPVKLTDREREVLKLILDDLSNHQIAGKLGISVRTVETHKQNLIAKTGVNSIAGLVVYALRNLDFAGSDQS